jgi:predicted  nucleic acid-binding Zn-ribbon protein
MFIIGEEKRFDDSNRSCEGRAVGENMKKIPELQARLDAALVTIHAASQVAADTAEVDSLKARTAELESQISAAHEELKAAQSSVEKLEKQQAIAARTADAQRQALVKQIEALDKARVNSEEDVAKARKFTKHLRKLNAALRTANAEMVGDPNLINAGLKMELDQVKAQRDVDLEEINGILARLTPLVEGN